MTDKKQGSSNHNRPIIQYRMQAEKKIQINRSFNNIRAQAKVMHILSYCIFGRKRYQNLYLITSLNCFYYALKIANNIHQRVPGLAMIIKFQDVDVIEYYSEDFQGKNYSNKRYSRVVIKLTKAPTEEDKTEPGYNPGLRNQDVKQPLTQVLQRKRVNTGEQRRNRQRGIREKKTQKKSNNNSDLNYSKNNNTNRRSENRQKRYKDQSTNNNKSTQRRNIDQQQDQRRYRKINTHYNDKGFKRYLDDREQNHQSKPVKNDKERSLKRYQPSKKSQTVQNQQHAKKQEPSNKQESKNQQVPKKQQQSLKKQQTSKKQQSSDLSSKVQQSSKDDKQVENNNANTSSIKKEEQPQYHRGQKRTRGIPVKAPNTNNRINEENKDETKPSQKDSYQDK